MPTKIILGIVVGLLVAGIGAWLLLSPKYLVPKKDGFINMYDNLPGAFERKQQLFSTGAIEEIASSFGIKEGVFVRTNEHGEGWSFVKNGAPILWDGTKEGTIDLYQDYSGALPDGSGEKETDDDTHLYFAKERAAFLSCYLGLPVSVIIKSYKEVWNSFLMGGYADADAVWLVVPLSNDLVEKADVAELNKVVTFVNHALGIFYGTNNDLIFDTTEGTMVYVKDRIAREDDPTIEDNRFNVRIKDSKVLNETYLRFKAYIENPNLLKECQSEKMSGIKSPFK